MECSEKLQWIDYTREELAKIQIDQPKTDIMIEVKKNWDSIAKPLDSMGRFEQLVEKIGGALGTSKIDLTKKAVLIFCADNGIVEEGISQSGQEVTLAVAKSMGQKTSSVGRMAAYVKADTIPVDIGICSDEKIEGVLDRKIRKGTANFMREPAMTEQETIRAIAVGIELVREMKEQGYHLLATGEMGIGNTTTSSAVTAALLKCPAQKVTGRGAGLSNQGLERKIQVIEKAREKYGLEQADALTVLQTVGGLDIAGLVGVCLGGGIYHIPIALDGVISGVAALVAENICPGVKEYLLPPHRGKEPALRWICDRLELEPVVDGNLALGEGTGAVMLFALLDMAMCIYNEKTTFTDIQVEQYERFEN